MGESLGRILQHPQQVPFRKGQAAVPVAEPSVPIAQGVPLSVLVEKQVYRLGETGDLGIEPGVGQFFRSCQDRARGRERIADFLFEHGAHMGFQRRVGGVHENQALSLE